MDAPRVVAFVMAGGEGTRLRPFTQEQPKPALPFGGSYRIVDFVLSNLYNSRIRSIYVLLEYRPEILLAHLAESWAFANAPAGEFVEPALSRYKGVGGGFRGTANAVWQSLDLLDGYRPDVVAVFAADHVYCMDVRQMVEFHVAKDADATVAAVPAPIELAPCLGVIRADAGGRIRGFQEKPRDPAPMPHDPRRVYGSMGNYLFRPAMLREALGRAAARGEHDFGQHVLPRLIHTHRVYAYDFSRNVIPGTRPCEEPAYWRDVGTVEAYVAAHWDLLGPHPRFCLDNPQWPVFSGNGARSVRPLSGGKIRHSILGPDTRFEGASLRHSVLQRGARVEPEARLEHCIIMDGAKVRRGARLRRVLVGPGNTLEAGASIGHDPRTDRQRYAVTPSGILVVPPRAREGAPVRAK